MGLLLVEMEGQPRLYKAGRFIRDRSLQSPGNNAGLNPANLIQGGAPTGA
jgi:hypothetical protein